MTPQEHSAALEAVRREKFDPTINNSRKVGDIDYGSAGLKIDTACQHLEESLPNHQLHRTQLAYRALVEGTQELGVWLRANGYDV